MIGMIQPASFVRSREQAQAVGNGVVSDASYEPMQNYNDTRCEWLSWIEA